MNGMNLTERQHDNTPHSRTHFKETRTSRWKKEFSYLMSDVPSPFNLDLLLLLIFRSKQPNQRIWRNDREELNNAMMRILACLGTLRHSIYGSVHAYSVTLGILGFPSSANGLKINVIHARGNEMTNPFRIPAFFIR